MRWRRVPRSVRARADRSTRWEGEGPPRLITGCSQNGGGSYAVTQPSLPAVEGHGGEDERAENDLRGGGVDVEHGDHEVERGDDQRAEAGAQVVAAAAHHRAADDHRGQAGEQVVVADVDVSAGAEPGEQDAGKPGKHGARRVHPVQTRRVEIPAISAARGPEPAR